MKIWKWRRRKWRRKFQLIYFCVTWLRNISVDSPILPHYKYASGYPPKWLFVETNDAFGIWLTVFRAFFMISDVNWEKKPSTISKNNHFGGYLLTYLWWGRIGEYPNMALIHVIKRSCKFSSSLSSSSLSFFQKYFHVKYSAL